jgi:F1F0 ATPase subunit 2
MNETASLFFALLGGLALGTFFFGGLRWTVHKGMMSNKPGLWFFGSLLFRVIVTVGGIYFVAGGNWKKALMCVLGFAIMRMIFIWNALKENK